MSPDTESLIRAIERIQGHTLVPEDIHSLIYHFISNLGSEAIYDCSGKSLEFKRGYIEGYSRRNGGSKDA
tara:strand:- start:277 stop:486 length:210 start_codon:yes stop_codon:yes gene_type:complete